MQEQHKTLCYEYKNATSLEEANACYATICCWWYSLGVVDAIWLEEWRFNLVFGILVLDNGEVS
jgi:hypothetical protein